MVRKKPTGPGGPHIYFKPPISADAMQHCKCCESVTPAWKYGPQMHCAQNTPLLAAGIVANYFVSGETEVKLMNNQYGSSARYVKSAEIIIYSVFSVEFKCVTLFLRILPGESDWKSGTTPEFTVADYFAGWVENLAAPLSAIPGEAQQGKHQEFSPIYPSRGGQPFGHAARGGGIEGAGYFEAAFPCGNAQTRLKSLTMTPLFPPPGKGKAYEAPKSAVPSSFATFVPTSVLKMFLQDELQAKSSGEIVVDAICGAKISFGTTDSVGNKFQTSQSEGYYGDSRGTVGFTLYASPLCPELLTAKDIKMQYPKWTPKSA